MARIASAVFFFATGLWAATVVDPGSKYSSLSAYMMEPDAEIAMAKSAAPDNISDHATVMVLTQSGYKTVVAGNNGFVCIVMRGWSAPTFSPAKDLELVYDTKLRAPICFDPVASKTVLPYQELRTKLGMQGLNPQAIANQVAIAYTKGELPKMDGVSFAYMWSADSELGPGVGAWHPHMMVYAPYYTKSMLGDDSQRMGPVVAADEGTPYALVVIPVMGAEAIHAKKVSLSK
jgi:hypothetical protein